MDNKAQVSFEYLIIISLMIIMSTLVMVIADGYILTSDTIKETAEIYSERTREMMEALR